MLYYVLTFGVGMVAGAALTFGALWVHYVVRDDTDPLEEFAKDHLGGDGKRWSPIHDDKGEIVAMGRDIHPGSPRRAH